MSTFYRQRPGWKFARAVRGEGVYVWDDTGRRLIDAAGGALVVNVGHGVREIADAIAAQASTLAYVHGTELTTEPMDALARELARRAPMDDARLYRWPAARRRRRRRSSWPDSGSSRGANAAVSR